MGGRSLRLCAVGDIFLGDTTLNLGLGVRSSIDRHGTDEFTAALAGIFRACDVGFGNLECVLSNEGLQPWRVDSAEMRGRPEFAGILARGGIDVANVANNHIFQHGNGAFRETVRALRDNGIRVAGEEGADGRSVPVVVERKGIRLVFLGYSLHYEQYRPGERCPYALRCEGAGIVSEVREIREHFSGHIVCSLHWGHEFVDHPSTSQQALARELVDAGVLLVLGHHPHVVQGIERYRRGLIAYSLGNFVFDFPMRELRETIALALDLGPRGISGFDVIPVVINDRFCPEPASAQEARRIRRSVQDLSKSLRRGVLKTDRELAALSRNLYRGYRWRNIRQFLTAIHRYHPFHSSQIVSRFVLRKLGLAHDP